MISEGRENKFLLKVWPLAGQSQCSEYTGSANCNQWAKWKKEDRKLAKG